MSKKGSGSHKQEFYMASDDENYYDHPFAPKKKNVTLTSKAEKSSTIPIPQGCVGLVIGRGGSNIKAMEMSSGARIKVETGKGENSRVRIMGEAPQIKIAERLIHDLVGQKSSKSIKINSVHIATIIGAGGKRIKEIQAISGATVRIIQGKVFGVEDKDRSGQSVMELTGTLEQITTAEEMIQKATSIDAKYEKFPTTVMSITGNKLTFNPLEAETTKQDIMDLFLFHPGPHPKEIQFRTQGDGKQYAMLRFDSHAEAQICKDALEGKMLNGTRKLVSIA